MKWHQQRHFGRTGHISFNNPDFVRYAESFGARGYRLTGFGRHWNGLLTTTPW
ncbi:hypothetical protein [Thiolapillus sp.]|uniref:hypothetical protein n=1 Tax=Thiolapillus sp. TaxID=2017437 RepID=UPI003AF9D8DB